mmetsp:Transcript_3356/g.10438  ORF Transcript_3356/g.10438 Transcript_3356/m.10438 type:complete len:278 (-) Transcript_3356:1991-2824(-)
MLTQTLHTDVVSAAHQTTQLSPGEQAQRGGGHHRREPVVERFELPIGLVQQRGEGHLDEALSFLEANLARCTARYQLQLLAVAVVHHPAGRLAALLPQLGAGQRGQHTQTLVGQLVVAAHQLGRERLTGQTPPQQLVPGQLQLDIAAHGHADQTAQKAQRIQSRARRRQEVLSAAAFADAGAPVGRAHEESARHLRAVQLLAHVREHLAVGAAVVGDALTAELDAEGAHLATVQHAHPLLAQQRRRAAAQSLVELPEERLVELLLFIGLQAVRWRRA